MNQSPVSSHWTQRAALILLACWTGLGLLQTGYVLLRPHGLIISRPPELDRTIGLPAAEDGRTVVAALDLLSAIETPAGAPILILRPVDADIASWDYVRFQLAQLTYPSRVDLVTTGAPAPLNPERYAALLAPPGVPVDDGWAQQLAGAELVLYQHAVEP